MKPIYHLHTVVRWPGCACGCNGGSLELFWPFLLQGKKGRKNRKEKDFKTINNQKLNSID